MHEFIAIGDIATDAFIRLKEATVHCDINKENCTISMAFGDKIPYESVEEVRAVGNSANAAVSASRLGLKSALITNIGKDEHGEKSIESLLNEKVDVALIKAHEGKKTNYHYVLWYEDDRTILVKHEEYEYSLPEFAEPKWLYLSSLGAGTEAYHSQIAEYLRMHPNVSLAFQPGTFQMKMGRDALRDIYTRTKILFCNVEEAERILGIDTLGIAELFKRLRDVGPEIIVITDGPKGAYSFDGTTALFHPPYPDLKSPYERTGAGDAFASTTVSALALGKDLSTALSWGAINSMSVVQQVGAQKGLLSQSQIEEYLKKAPADFKAKNL